MSQRSTFVVHGRLAIREIRLQAARNCNHGVQVMTFEQLAARLAGGFARPIDGDTLREAIEQVLPVTPLGELDGIKSLPGMVSAAVDTLRKVWHAGIDLSARAAEHPRLAAMAKLESAVLAVLPGSMMRPADLVAAALPRLVHAPLLLGSAEIMGMTELSPCWRPLLQGLAAQVPTRWAAGARTVPAWLEGCGVGVVHADPCTPRVTVTSAATAHHEAIEALRWARALLASGAAKPADIAIASTTPAEYDDHLLALRTDSDVGPRFVHGVKVTATREGQAVAALADTLLRGLSQPRIRRLGTLLAKEPGPFNDLPSGWMQILPADAPLTSIDTWHCLLERLAATDWPDAIDHSATLRTIVDTLHKGIAHADGVGAVLLTGRSLAIWKKALLAGPPASLDATLDALKQDDGLEACVSVAWMPASALAASPRKHVRLLGLNSTRWPRRVAEDRLLSDHIIPIAELDPLPVAAADRRDFHTILVTTEREVVLSRSRRDGEGRILGRSPLLQGYPEEIYVRRNTVPAHAMSESDRLLARPGDFATLPQAAAAAACWHDWRRHDVTAHDGLVRPNHPLLLAILERTQSASSLRRLLRNPLGYVWHYGLRWRAPEDAADPLVLDGLGIGSLVHEILDNALRRIEAKGAVASASRAQVEAAVAKAAIETSDLWKTQMAVPPAVIWQRTLNEAQQMAVFALMYRDGSPSRSRSYGEVPFGGAEAKSDTAVPWDHDEEVEIPDTGFRIRGYIDRLDICAGTRSALVRDYKTGKSPKSDIILDQGRELQRCLYAFAVKALLGSDYAIATSLLFLRDEKDLMLADPDSVLKELSTYLLLARAGLTAGNGLMGPDTGSAYDDLAFALPANAAATYCNRKSTAVNARLGEATMIWDAQ